MESTTGCRCPAFQWADDAVSLGWHKDDDHDDLGRTHFQIDTGTELVHEPGDLEAEAPASVLESCLCRLPETLERTIDSERDAG